jgi:hypothetical protein
MSLSWLGCGSNPLIARETYILLLPMGITFIENLNQKNKKELFAESSHLGKRSQMSFLSWIKRMTKDKPKELSQDKARLPGYYWGKYADFEVLVMKENGYINATRLCKDGHKTFQFWLQKQESKDLVAALSKHLGISKLIVSIKDQEYRGVYVHPSLIVNIINWVSADYAFRLAKAQYDEVDVLTTALNNMSIDKEKCYRKVKRQDDLSLKRKDDLHSLSLKRKDSLVGEKTINDIIKIVAPVIVITDLSKDIKPLLRDKIGAKPRGGVYMLFNKRTNNYYIGSSKNVVARVSSYLIDSYVTTPARYRNLIKEAMIKYTKNAFAVLILELPTRPFEREKYYIDLLEPKYNTDLYIKE